MTNVAERPRSDARNKRNAFEEFPSENTTAAATTGQ
jgi:hypothetical protein